MRGKTKQPKVKWTPADRARHKATRDKFQRERPTQDQLLTSGQYIGPIRLGTYLEIRHAMAELKRSREAAGLSLAAVSRRSGIAPAALSRLENGRQANPTLDTIYRYAAAVGKQIAWVLQDAPDPA